MNDAATKTAAPTYLVCAQNAGCSIQETYAGKWGRENVWDRVRSLVKDLDLDRKGGARGGQVTNP